MNEHAGAAQAADALRWPMNDRLLAALLAALLVGACTTTGWIPARTPATGEPWDIPPEDYPTQRLYRVQYEDPQDEAAFKLTLYLAAADRYRMSAADGLGRKLWTLDVESGGDALWLDHRENVYCRARSAESLVLVPLARLPLTALPRLLLGRMPVAPATEPERGETHVAYDDVHGQRWNGRLESDGRLAWWSLNENGDAVAWWRPDPDHAGGTFIDRRADRQVHWQETVRETLADPLERLPIPVRYRRGDCGVGEET